MKKTLLMLIMLSLVGCQGKTEETDVNDIQSMREQARQHAEEGDFSKSVNLLTDALEHPDVGDKHDLKSYILLERGNNYAYIGEKEKACLDWEQAVGLYFDFYAVEYPALDQDSLKANFAAMDSIKTNCR